MRRKEDKVGERSSGRGKKNSWDEVKGAVEQKIARQGGRRVS